MDYDNNRDRYQSGFDAGLIIDGEIQYDPDRQEYIMIDDEKKAFSTQEMLKTLVGKRIRLTCISFESIEYIENLINQG